MISTQALRAGVVGTVGAPFPLVRSRGVGRVVATDNAGLDMLVDGLRVRLSWSRLDAVVRRLSANYTLGVDELGAGQDAVGIVSLLSEVLVNDVTLIAREGLLVLRRREGPPVHPYADMGGLVRRWPRHRQASGS
jgi:hypothetical protein